MRSALLAAAVAVASTFSIPAHAEDGATKDEGSLAKRRVYFGELLAASTAGLYSSLFAYVGAGFVVGNEDTSKTGSILLVQSAVKSAVLVTADAALLMALTRQIYLSLGPTLTYSSVSLVPDGHASGFGVGATAALGISL